jgi:hypothetical protein
MMVWQGFQQTAMAIGVAFSARKVTGVMLSLGLVAIAPTFAVAEAVDLDTTATHLYGTSPTADQIGQDYMILRFTDTNQVEGGVYQINSEFACFSGEVAQGKLNLAVIDPYEQIAYDYQLNYQASQPIAASGDRLTTEFVPEGYYAIPSPSDLAMEVLSACMDEVPQDV